MYYSNQPTPDLRVDPAAGRDYNHSSPCLTNKSFAFIGSAITSFTIFSILDPCEPFTNITSPSLIASCKNLPAAALSAKERSAIARKAAEKRWGAK